MTRPLIAMLTGLTICACLVVPFALAINRFDWGVGLLLVAPLLVWLLMQIGKRLERWARYESDSLPPDPDFPDED